MTLDTKVYVFGGADNCLGMFVCCQMQEQEAFGCLLLPPPCPSAAVKSSTANWKWRQKKFQIFGKINLQHFSLILIYGNSDYMLLDIVHLADWCAINTTGNIYIYTFCITFRPLPLL